VIDAPKESFGQQGDAIYSNADFQKKLQKNTVIYKKINQHLIPAIVNSINKKRLI
jgi:hypothetical protein